MVETEKESAELVDEEKSVELGAEADATVADADLPDITEQVKASLEKIRPYLQADGGDIEFVEVASDNKVVRVRLRGACHGCPGAIMTLKLGVERILRRDIPGIETVEAVPY